MDTVQTSNKWLWRVGDQGTVVYNAQPNDDYGTTKGKVYPATIIRCNGWSALFQLVDDLGRDKVETADRNNDRDGYESFTVTMSRVDYNARCNEYHTQRVKELTDEFEADLKELERQHSERWRQGNA